MHVNFQDPAFLIPLGVILIALVLLVWALGKLFKKEPDSADLSLEDQFPSLSSDQDLFNTPLPEVPLPPVVNREAPAPVAAGANREMASRLDNMTQKLSDMQTVLQRQAAAAPAGTPLTPETIDKLLKIIGNVTQQVDLLQKSLGATATPGQPVGQPGMPAAGSPKPTVTSAANPAPSAGGKPIGVTGGALSSFPKQTPPGQKSAAAPGTPPTTPGADPIILPSGK